MTIAEERELDPTLRLIAALSRLLDLHNTRHGRGEPAAVIAAPLVQDDAALFLWIGTRALQLLHERYLEEGSGPVAAPSLLEDLRRELPAVTAADLDYVLRFLATGRPLAYLAADRLPGEEVRRTQDSTVLVKRDRRFDLVKLTDNARLVMRVGALHKDWLYEDKDVERVPAAIERGRFTDLPRIALEVCANLRSMNERLTEIEESPTFEGLRAELEAQGPTYREMLKKAQEAAAHAVQLLRLPLTRERFEAWALAAARDDLYLEDMLAHVEPVARAVESLSRHFVAFLKQIQSARRAPLGVVRFDAIAQDLVERPRDLTALAEVLGGLMPWQPRAGFFHPSLFIDRVELEDPGLKRRVVVYDERGDDGAQPRFKSFLERHRAWILARLGEGPLAFSRLAAEGGYLLEPHESPADLFGIYTLAGDFGERIELVVGHTGQRFHEDFGRWTVHADDPTIQRLDHVAGQAA